MANLRRLPNLAALRAFEAAARHQNFSRAAEEVHLTHGAISHQVRALEEELGVQLFTRNGKRIVITADGQQFAELLRKSLTDIAEAAEALTASSRQKRVTITSLPSFAARWLTPRLGHFIELHPDIEVMLQSSSHLTDFAREAVDVAIRFGSGNYPGLSQELLMDDYYYPVASPQFHGGELPRTPEELGRSNLLRCDMEPWVPWFRAAQLDLPEPTGGIIFYDASMGIRAAVEGHGIALVRHAMVESELISGKLVRLFDITVRCPFSYYLVCLSSALQKPQVQAFRAWIFSEIEKLKTAPPTTPP
jgi:LysR family glycine cleavage system transcriptional activator